MEEKDITLNLTVVILTYNESIHLPRLLANLKHFASRVVIVDSFSTDNTVALATKSGAEVHQHAFVNQAKQFQWALDNVTIKTEWVMRLDADEVLEADLQNELRDKLPTLPTSVVGINLKRKHIFMGRWIRFGGRYPLIMLRIWRNGFGRVEDRWMDEHIAVVGGSTITLNASFADHNLHDLTFFTAKHNSYATREAIDILSRRYGLTLDQSKLSAANSSSQAAIKRFLKQAIYNRLPFTVSASAYFFWRYVIRFGFLDGRPGLVYHFLQGYWYRFLVGAKVMEIEAQIGPHASKERIVEAIRTRTGHDFSV